ncbi:uncharacterized protein BJ171DRAFT_502649 [Polychytrium aggregatum]|uniref:uncharacterized protein n=1 Tax=Polychytrium aggregatum TaxID=110093 RepID=UPI0022FDE4A7|nr:uncharacterized protein BJ171DRAFT_502649 [Polychytrium aggregatum]KAI9205010.1 hypothetical protein BJ171DRAFT_502649 [Polychytrium aggregatum]
MSGRTAPSIHRTKLCLHQPLPASRKHIHSTVAVAVASLAAAVKYPTVSARIVGSASAPDPKAAHPRLSLSLCHIHTHRRQTKPSPAPMDAPMDASMQTLLGLVSERLREDTLFVVWKDRRRVSVVTGTKDPGKGRGNYTYEFVHVDKTVILGLYRSYSCVSETHARDQGFKFLSSASSSSHRRRYFVFDGHHLHELLYDTAACDDAAASGILGFLGLSTFLGPIWSSLFSPEPPSPPPSTLDADPSDRHASGPKRKKAKTSPTSSPTDSHSHPHSHSHSHSHSRPPSTHGKPTAPASLKVAPSFSYKRAKYIEQILTSVKDPAFMASWLQDTQVRGKLAYQVLKFLIRANLDPDRPNDAHIQSLDRPPVFPESVKKTIVEHWKTRPGHLIQCSNGIELILDVLGLWTVSATDAKHAPFSSPDCCVHAFDIEHIVSNSFGTDNRDTENGVILDSKVNRSKGNRMLFLLTDSEIDKIKDLAKKQRVFLKSYLNSIGDRQAARRL